jgi:TetR/AcrR family fatty acid metabolism transcriptional regulator
MTRTVHSLRDKVHAATQEAMLDAAQRALVKYGYQKATMQQIATETGCAPGTFYLYFKNKQQLFEAIVSRHWGTLFGRTQAAMAGCDNPLEKLRLGLIAVFEFQKENELFFKVALTAFPLRHRRLEAKLKELGPQSAQMTQMVIGELRRAQKQGLIRKDVSAQTLHTFMDAVMTSQLEEFVLADKPPSADQAVKVLWGLLMGGLGREV